MPPKIDKVGTKCLATAPGQSYMVEVWEKDQGSLSTAASPQHWIKPLKKVKKKNKTKNKKTTQKTLHSKVVYNRHSSNTDIILPSGE